MKRLTAVAVGLLVLAACQDSTTPTPDGQDTGRPNISISSPGDYYGFVDGYFSFLKPLVGDPSVSGTTLNTHLMPKIELWRKDQLLIEPIGTDHACTPQVAGTMAMDTFTPQPNTDSTYYEYGWKTSDNNLTTGVEYRLCVKVQLATGPQLVGWRDIRPDKTNDPNSPPGTPYLFQNGSNIPIKFWLSGKSLCFDAVGNVIDCTIATFDSNGGTAVCDSAQCGIYVPQGVIPSGEKLATFVVKYVTCPDSSVQVGTVDYLKDLDIPQYPGCLEVTAYANYDISVGFGAGDFAGITTAACRDKAMLGPQDERLLLHLESPTDSKAIYALPTRPFDLNCDPTTVAKAPGADGSIGDWARYYVARGAQAFERTFLPFVNPPDLNAAHAGFGGGTSLTCTGGSSGADGVNPVTSCSTPSLVAGNAPAAEPIPPGTPVTFKMVWALPSKIVARYQVTAFGSPLTTTNWIDPMSVAPGGTLYPAVKVTDECREDYSDPSLPEDCAGDVQRAVEGARVWFDVGGSSPVYGYTNADGIAYPSAGWTVPTAAGLYTATASGLGIGVDPSLASVTLSPPPAAGTYQDHIGNNAVLLQAPKVKFDASVCSDKSYLLDQGLDPNDYDGSVAIPISLSGSSSDVAYLYWTTDCYRTYFAFVVPQAPDFTNTLRMVFVDDLVTRFGFDPTNPVEFSAVPQLGDDLWLVERDTDKKSSTYGQWKVGDWHVSDDCTGSSKQSECGRSDTSAGHTNDLVPANGGAVYMLGSSTVYEFARVFPAVLANADSYDFTLPPVGGSTWIAFYLTSNRGNAPQADLEYPDFRVFLPIQIIRQ